MSRPHIDRDPSLKRFRDEGYNVRYKDGHLIVWDIPYLNAQGELKRGKIICPADLQDGISSVPAAHTVHFSGEAPYDASGRPLPIVAGTGDFDMAGERWDLYLSVMPTVAQKYDNFYTKLATYATRISGPAIVVHPGVTAKTRQAVVADEDDSVFILAETWSAHARISAIVNRVKGHRIAIVGLGGTGAHVLDLLAKTPVQEIHLYDGDRLEQRNVWRFPGAVPAEAINARTFKVGYLAQGYSPLRRGIVPHQVFISEANLAELAGFDFVFICVDRGSARRLVADFLHAQCKAFIDVGMGILVSPDNKLLGQLRTTFVAPGSVLEQAPLPFAEQEEDDPYSQNVQIVDMNSLNATLAVIRWKKFVGIYADMKGESSANYTIATNKIAHSSQDRSAEGDDSPA